MLETIKKLPEAPPKKMEFADKLVSKKYPGQSE